MLRAITTASAIAMIGVLIVFINMDWFRHLIQSYFILNATSSETFKSRDLPKMAEYPTMNPQDPNSFSRPDQWKTVHIHINVRVDFERHILAGMVELTVERQEKTEAEQLVLDTRDLKITDVIDADSGDSLSFNIDQPFLAYGSKLDIQLPALKNTVKVRITYETSPNSSALQWLSPQQTAGKKHPYLFSQCQAIHARSMLPCQDSPSVKSPFTATVVAPKELVVLMGALKKMKKENSSSAVENAHHFTQPMPVPSYLIAIAVGNLERREISPRCDVWSEKEFVDQAAFEFSETETMLKTGESLMGPYIWGRYDLLVLPPSFPFGGMENPCLTFVTPTLLAGDKSLATVVAHEISHSWTGNLVTNKNFEHFWMNEGFTVFLERKIIGRMKGESCRHFQAIIGWKELIDSINMMGEENPLTCLVVNLTGVDPDDAFSTVPYEKGHSFLFYLEEKLGGAEIFEPFLKSYIQHYQNKSIDTFEWKQYFLDYFEPLVSRDVLDSINWDSWLHQPGMPPVNLSFDTTLATECTILRERWVTEKDFTKFSEKDIANMSSLQITEFLSQLLQQEPLSVEKFEAMTKIYSLNEKKNSEIKFRWLRLGIRSRWMEIVQHALDFVAQQGRMKYVRPIYRDLYAWESVRQRAIDAYMNTRSQMMYVSASMIAKDLHLKQS